MLIAMKAMRNTTLKGLDGELGTLDDLFFDDESWVVRYLVVDTGGWLTGREIILSPEVVEQADWSHNALAVKLTKQQVQDSPGVSTDKPVSRQHEKDLAQYYGWQPYWTPLTGVSPHGPHTATAKTAPPEPHVEQKTRLRSAVEVQNYRLHANDGDMGHVEDYIVDDADWVVRYLVVNTRKWLPGKDVLMPPEWCTDIRWDEHRLHVDVTREQVKAAPAYEPTAAINRQVEERLYDFYGRPVYWG